MALLAVVCDHPAMCKMGGFADHSHNEAPCNKCHVDQASIFSDESLQNSTTFLSDPDVFLITSLIQSFLLERAWITARIVLKNIP